MPFLLDGPFIRHAPPLVAAFQIQKQHDDDQIPGLHQHERHENEQHVFGLQGNFFEGIAAKKRFHALTR